MQALPVRFALLILRIFSPIPSPMHALPGELSTIVFARGGSNGNSRPVGELVGTRSYSTAGYQAIHATHNKHFHAQPSFHSIY